MNFITKQCYMCTNLVSLCFSQKLEQIAGFHQFENDEVWIVVDAYSNDLENVLMVKVAKEVRNTEKQSFKGGKILQTTFYNNECYIHK